MVTWQDISWKRWLTAEKIKGKVDAKKAFLLLKVATQALRT